MVVMKKTADQLAELKDLLSKWESSGLSLRAFGRQEGVSYWKLIYWRRRLGEEPPAPEVRLAPVRVLPDTLRPSNEPIRVLLANGISLDVPETASRDHLARVMEVVSGC